MRWMTPGEKLVTGTPGRPELVLASASPRRRDLLAQYGYRCRIVPAPITESDAGWLTVRELVLLNAGRKAASVQQREPHAVVLGVDTLVSLDGKALGKPPDYAAAAAMLERLAGREHQVYSGVCLTQQVPRRTVCFVALTSVRFHPLTPEGIAAYLDLIDPLDKAGGYAAQEHGERIIASMTGSWTNVMGLPMKALSRVLRQQFAIVPATEIRTR